jgi:hypothetical protein
MDGESRMGDISQISKISKERRATVELTEEEKRIKLYGSKRIP